MYLINTGSRSSACCRFKEREACKMARQKQYIGVRQRSDGRFEKRFTMDGKQYSVYGASAKECTEKEITKRQEIAAGTYKNNSSVTLDDFFKEWYRIKSNTLKSKT